jgi:hypothetical protein
MGCEIRVSVLVHASLCIHCRSLVVPVLVGGAARLGSE